jgi:hypothetical protein
MTDKVEHGRDRPLLEQFEPFAFRRADKFVTAFGGEDRPYRDQVIAGVEPLGDLADLLAQRLAVAEVRGAGERVDLASGVVDIIFLGDPKARCLEQTGERIADHRAPAMAHVHRSGRIGRNIFDINPLVLADVGKAVALSFREDRHELVAPTLVGQPQVDEPGTCNLDRGYRRQRLQLGRDQSGQRARIGSSDLS